jgi:hypothetical protein
MTIHDIVVRTPLLALIVAAASVAEAQWRHHALVCNPRASRV